jgi:hypothetical protein
MQSEWLLSTSVLVEKMVTALMGSLPSSQSGVIGTSGGALMPCILLINLTLVFLRLEGEL